MKFFIYSFIIILLLLFLFRYFLKFKEKKAQFETNERNADTKEYSLELLQADEKLLDEAKELISFHKNNTDTVNIKNEVFRLQNLLNEVYGIIEPLAQEKHSTFLYDIDINVPIELIGDTLVLEQILYNLLSSTIQVTENTNIIVRVEKTHDKNEKLLIEIINTKHSITNDELEQFNIHCNETKSTETLCSAKKLIEHMNGKLSINKKEDGISYLIELPFLHNEFYQEAYYTLPPTIEKEKILWIEDNSYAISIIEKMIHYFHLDITIKNSSQLAQLKNFELYNMIIIDMKYLTRALTRHLEEIKHKKTLHIISLETFLGTKGAKRRKGQFIDKYLYKPFTLGMIYELLYNTYVMQDDDTLALQKSNTEVKRGEIVFIEDIPDITRESFQDFNIIHVLVVEDNRTNQKILQSVLERSDIQLTIANNGKEALTALEEDHTVDIVLMDINMPIMDGYEASRRIRQMDDLDNLPIVVVSGLGFRNEIEKMYIAGADAHLTKPFKIGQLYNAFKIFLTKEANAEEVSEQTQAYIEDKSILDTGKGIANTHNIIQYRDALREMLVLYRSSDESIKELIIKNEINALYQYCRTTQHECNELGLGGLSNVLNEMILLMTSKEEEILQKYILLYHEEWVRTKRNIELYLKSVDTH